MSKLKKRTPTTNKPKPPAKSGSRAERKVWRFIDYGHRWGGGCDDLHILPKYIKWYINGWEGCEGEILTAMNQLRAESDFIWLQGALVELLSRATNTDIEYQGYILTSRREPASASDIGRMLRLTGRGAHKQAEAALHKLSMAGFLENVPVPNWDGSGLSKNVTTPEKGVKRQKKPDSGVKNEGGSLKGKGKSATQKEKRENEESAAQTREKRRQENIKLCEQIKREGKGQDSITTTTTANRGLSPTTSPSMTSTKSDAGQVCKQDDPESSRIPALPSVSHVGDIVKLRAFRYDADAWQFADDVLVRSRYFTILDCERARHSDDGYTSRQQNERAHWAKAWHKAKEVFDSDSLEVLQSGIFKRAEKLGANRYSKKNPESYLMSSWNNLVRDQKRKIGSKRGVG